MRIAVAFLIVPLLCGVPASSQTGSVKQEHPGPEIPRMVSPSIDRADEPFSYPSQSVDEVGALYSPSAAELTPDGALYTGFGELVFYGGIERVQLNNRVRTLEKGYLPVIRSVSQRDGLTYASTYFASTLADGTVANFVRVSIANPGHSSRIAYLTASWRFSGPQTTTFPTGDNRFRRPLNSERVGDFHQPGELFNPKSVYSLDGDAVLRDGKVMYLFPQDPAPKITPSYRDYYNRKQGDDASQPLANTPMTTVEYVLPLSAGAERSLVFKVPLLPTAPDTPALAAIHNASFDAEHAKVIAEVEAIVGRGMQVETAEPKVNELFRSSLVYCLLALNHVDDHWIQTINQFQYHRFYLRDSADFVRMYDTTGYSDIAAKVLDFYAARQAADGNFVSQPGQYDGWGLAVWSIVEHYRMTHDHAYAEAMLSRIEAAVRWLDTATAKDPLHLMPSTDVRDNEYIPGHLTGYNFLALDGLDAAVRMAHEMGRSDDEQHFRASHDALRAAFLKQLDAVAKDGYIPPALDGKVGGTDWGNLLSLVPEPQLSPFDPRVTATLQRTQGRYQEGLMTYNQPEQGIYLHHYLTIKNTLSELIRGEDEQAVRELDAVLVHTTSTNAGWEYSVRPWGDRDFSGNLTPHGWFAAEYRNLLRNMLVREEGDQLHLLSAVSPAWIGAGKHLKVIDAQTYFGVLSFDLAMPDEGHAVLDLKTEMQPKYAARSFQLHLPWFEKVSKVTVDGKAVAVTGRSIQLPATAKRVEIAWARQLLAVETPASYDDAVDRYKQEYKRRYVEATGALIDDK